MKRLLFLFLTLAITACSSTLTLGPLTASPERVNFPAEGETASAELGDNLLSYALVNERPAIGIKDEHTYSVCAFEVNVGPQDATARNINVATNSPIYWLTAITIDAFGGRNLSERQNGVYRDASGQMVVVNQVCGSPQPFVNDYEEITVTEAGSGSFRQELIYNGKTGNSVKFIYREFNNDMARPAFTQEAMYDLGESTVIGFKGARLDILEATNREVRYRVISQFSGL